MTMNGPSRPTPALSAKKPVVLEVSWSAPQDDGRVSFKASWEGDTRRGERGLVDQDELRGCFGIWVDGAAVTVASIRLAAVVDQAALDRLRGEKR